MKKLLSLICTLVLLFSSICVLTACDDTDGEKQIDETKTQLHVANFDGGYGHAWLEQAVGVFEEKYAQTSFEEGKTGVQVWITNQKDEIEGYTLFTTIDKLQQDVFLTQQPRQEIIDGNLIIPLDDILDEPLTEFGETKTIREKISTYYKESMDMENVTFLPYAEAYFGNMVYDIDLFEKNGFFIATDGSWTTGKTGAKAKSVGMDGIAGTYDDGLPTTDTEFFALCDYIRTREIIPVTFAGQYEAYMNAWVKNVAHNFDDGANSAISSTLQGTMRLVGDSEDSPTVFNGRNSYDLARMPGSLAGLESAYKLVKNSGNYSSNAFKTTQSQIEAQDEFLMSAEDEQEIAMLIEGTWWESEASETFSLMERIDSKYSKQNRRLGLMPCFRCTEVAGIKATGTKCSFYTTNMAMFVNATTSHVDLSKLFIKFLCSDQALEIFTAVTGCPSCYDYEISEQTYNSFSNFGKCVWEIHTNKDGAYVFYKEVNPINEMFVFNVNGWGTSLSTNIGSSGSYIATYNCPFKCFKFDTSHPTAMDYMNGAYDLSCAKYDRYYASKYGARN